MALNLADKQAIVAKVSKVASGAVSVTVADYSGVPVSKMTAYRAAARKKGIQMIVVRNNLARRAFENTEFSGLNDSLVGSMVLMFCVNEPGAAARLLMDTIKEKDALRVKAIALAGKIYGVNELKTIAELPTKDEAIAKFMGTMLAPVEKLVRTIAAVRDQKQETV